MKPQIIQKKRNTGRNLVLLNAGITRDSLFQVAKNSSLRLAHFHDYMKSPEDFLQAFLDGDGIYFESLNVAVINLNKEDRLEHMNRNLTHKPFCSSSRNAMCMK